MPLYPGFIGASGRVRSVNVNAEQTINWYPEQAPGNPKVKEWLAPTPGLEPFTVLNAGPVRAVQSMDGRTFSVGGTVLYEVLASGVYVGIGGVALDANPACLSSSGSNGHQLFITSGGENYIYDLITGVLTTLIGDVTGPPTPTIMSCFSDGYFIALKRNTNQFNVSALYDGLTWDPLDVFQVSTVADQTNALVENHRDLWLLGTQTSSVWSNTGDEIIYQPIPGVKIDQGCAAAFSAVRIDNAVMWLGQSEVGSKVVWRADGYTPRRVSTHAVEYALAQAPRVDDAIAWVYQEEGHTFYVLYVPALADVRGFGTTWVYDVATNAWHERALWDSTAEDWQPHPGRCHAYGFGRHLVGDRSSGAIYAMRLGLASDTLVVPGGTGGGPGGGGGGGGGGGPTPPPTLVSVAPNSGQQGTAQTVALTGTGFVPAATTPVVSGADVVVADVVVSSATALTADVWIAPGATPGGRAVTVTTATGTSDSRTFTVTATPAPGSTDLLTPADLTYLGMFGAPADTGAGDSWGFNYQRGSITGRYVAGQLRLLMTGSGDSAGNSWNGHHLYEIVPPAVGTLTTDPATAPLATMLKDWGSMSPVYRPIVDTNGSILAGLLWDPTRNAVWYAYHARYNVSGWNDPSIGVAVLNDTTGTLAKYGHWRTKTGSKRTGGYMLDIPADVADAHFGGRRMGLGAHTTSGNSTAPWGPVLQPAAFLTDYATRPTDTLESTPGESAANGPTGAHPRWSMESLDLLFHDISHKKARHTDGSAYRYCGWGTTPGVNDPGVPPYDCSNGSWVTTIDNVWYLDSAFAGVWIDTPTKSGVCYFARINVPSPTYPIVHQWYSPGPCCHGQVDIRKADSTPGDQSSSMRNHLLIYDPQEFIDRAHGTIANYELQETHVADMADTYFSGSTEWEDDAYKIDGAWFDSFTNRLYVVKGDRDPRHGGSPGRPMIYVFEVAV